MVFILEEEEHSNNEMHKSGFRPPVWRDYDRGFEMRRFSFGRDPDIGLYLSKLHDKADVLNFGVMFRCNLLNHDELSGNIPENVHTNYPNGVSGFTLPDAYDRVAFFRVFRGSSIDPSEIGLQPGPRLKISLDCPGMTQAESRALIVEMIRVKYKKTWRTLKVFYQFYWPEDTIPPELANHPYF